MKRAPGCRGLSPLARGNRRKKPKRGPVLGPIPARAGQPEKAANVAFDHGAYPRSRGATVVFHARPLWWWGLSPLARGNPTRGVGAALLLGPIPARAGQPWLSPGTVPAMRAYPRSRGATAEFITDLDGGQGLSPLARGNHAGHCRAHLAGRPIPARAGQPPSRGARAGLCWAYPRSRGATVDGGNLLLQVQGLSPLARGNHPDMSG